MENPQPFHRRTLTSLFNLKVRLSFSYNTRFLAGIKTTAYLGGEKMPTIKPISDLGNYNNV